MTSHVDPVIDRSSLDEEDFNYGEPSEASKESVLGLSCETGLPDGDTAFSDLDDIDKVYNLASDLLFFLGSVCYLAVAGWTATTSSVNGDAPWVAALSLVGPVLYAFNANVEIAWAIHNMRRHHGESMRRREAAWDLCSNLFFGFAAAIDVAGAVNHRLRSDDVVFEADLYSFSAHLYFLSGLVAVVGFNFSCASCYQLLIGTGDILFLIGSLSDLVLSYVTRVLTSNMERKSFDLISCTLWLVNAILYILADLLAYLRSRRSQNSQLKQAETDPQLVEQPVPYMV